jgi:glycosyltransferase involved in cell wall biosynthesis
LLRALALLKQRYDLRIPLVCSGGENAFLPKIQREVRRLRLEDQVTFTGFVSSLEVRGLYQLAHMLVFPTKFEGWGMPLFEAFFSGLPAACSDISPLAEQAGDAALLFNPDQPTEMADAMARLWRDDALRARMIERGRGRVAPFTWERTARIFRAHYRRIAGRAPTEEDRELLEAPPLL